MKFESYHIAGIIKQNLSKLEFKRPTDIQFKAIPSILKGEDVLAIAQTGTGKTAAFVIPILDGLLKKKSKPQPASVTCLVMVPTRELAIQIETVFSSLAGKTKIKILSIHGGADQDPQISALAKGVDVLIATPGRMFDLISQKKLRLDRVSVLVLDEADRMLGLGFIEDIQAIKKMLGRRHQTLFFSATINKQIKRLAFSLVKSNAIRIQISPDDPVSKNVSHFVIHVEMDEKRFFLRRFIQDHPDSKIMVFVRTRVRAERVLKALERTNIDALTLHGEKDQTERNDALNQFKTKDIRILIATDVSARGIDIPQIDYVINYDLPDDDKTYVHRVGRTGRGRLKGKALSFCSPGEEEQLQSIQTFLGRPIEKIHMNKKDYRDITSTPLEQQSLEDMIREIESFDKKKRKKGKS